VTKPKGLVFYRAFPGVVIGGLVIVSLLVFSRKAAMARGKESAANDDDVHFSAFKDRPVTSLKPAVRSCSRS
jgi:hypothetical protein